MIDELTLYNLEVKYHNLKDIANAIEEMVRAEVIDECIEMVALEYEECAYIIHGLEKLKGAE